MKKIFIYYSLTGNGDMIADHLKRDGYDIRKIKVKKELPKSFLFKMLSGGFKAAIDYKETLVDFDHEVAEYDEVVIGSPVWNSRLSTPAATALKTLDLTDKKVTFLLYSGSGSAKKATEFIHKNYPGSKIVNLKEPKKEKEEIKKL